MEITIQQLDTRLKGVESEVHRIGGTLDLVYTLLKGNDLDESGGMVKKVNGLDERVKKLEDKHRAEGWMNKIFWVAVGVVIVKLIDVLIKVNI